MKPISITSIFLLLSITAAHSWLHCTDHDNKDILEWMKSNVTQYGSAKVIDPLMPWYANLCHGWPRAKQNPGDWVDESSNYLWDVDDAMGRGDTHACHPSQRNPIYFASSNSPNLQHHTAPAPMASATPGGTIKLMYGGNGHSRGYNAGGNGDAGRVAVYWAGSPETEIADIKDFSAGFLVQEQGFSEEAFMFPDDEKVVTPAQGLQDKGNWMSLKLPECMEKGRHMMIWVWSWGGKPKYTTCFDVMIN